MKNESNDWIYDIEFYRNFFLMNVMKYPERDQKRSFAWTEWGSCGCEDINAMMEFLQQPDLRMIGYNNTGYDYPVLHFFMEDPTVTLEEWYEKVQERIFPDPKKGQQRKMVWENQRKVFQIDLFKVNHYDNPARSCSLKWLEFTMRWPLVQDLPIKPHELIVRNDVEMMIQYCWNDIKATAELADKSWRAVEFRERLSDKLDINVMDYSDVKIGEYLTERGYLQRTGISKWDLKKKRSQVRVPSTIPINMVIPEIVDFKTEILSKWLWEELYDKTIKNNKKSDKQDKDMIYDIVINPVKGIEQVVHKGIPTLKKELETEQKKLKTIVRFAKGGLHSVDMPRIITRKEGWVLAEKDVGSMYPRQIVVDRIYPEHLGEEWFDAINDMYHFRVDKLKPLMKSIIKDRYKGDYLKAIHDKEYISLDDEQAVYKLAMNGGGFGKLGSEWSWQYDPEAKYRVTIGGELKLLMLIEAFVIRGVDIVSVNTDGVVIHYPKEKQQTVDRICNWWMDLTKFELEDTFYDKLIMSSVNDYIAVITDGAGGKVSKVKYKGDFEIDKELHKNNSQRIVPIALSEYFLHGRPLKDTIRDGAKFTNPQGVEETINIYDFCIGRKATKDSKYILVKKGQARDINQKVIRYYIANTTDTLIKKYLSGKMKGSHEAVNKGWNIQTFFGTENSYLKRKGWNINYLYYINECSKIIHAIDGGTRWLEKGIEEQTKIKL